MTRSSFTSSDLAAHQKPLPPGFAMHWHELAPHVVGKMRNMVCVQRLFVLFLIALMMAGNALQIIGLNFWLRSFSDGSAGSFTVFSISGLNFALFFLAWLVIYCIMKKPDLTFLKSRRGWYLLFAIGFMDTINSMFAIYAANYTPELLQAIFMALTPIYTCVMSKYLLKDTRRYSNPWVLVSFFLMIGGVAVASGPDMANSTSEDNSQIAWTIIFFISVPLASLYNVWQAQYMEEMTIKPSAKKEDDDDDDDNIEEDSELESRSSRVGSLIQRESTIAGGTNDSTGTISPNAPPVSPPSTTDAGATSTIAGGYGGLYHSAEEATDDRRRKEEEAQAALLTPDGVKRGEDMIVKLVMLFGDTGLQFIMTMCLLPADAIPWFGQSSSVANAGDAFGKGIECIFTCNMNGLYCALYSAGFVFTYIGSAYLNHYSATLCSMIGQLSSPVTALLLIIIPQWNLAPSTSSWIWSVAAIFLLSVGTVIYFAWEEMTAPTEDGSMVTLLGADGLPRQRLPATKEEADALYNNATRHRASSRVGGGSGGGCGYREEDM